MKDKSITKIIAKIIEEAAGAAADASIKIDNLPASPPKLAERIISQFENLRERRASSDPTWAEIERKRKIEGSENKVFIGENLSFADMDKQREIEQLITPNPWWYNSLVVISQKSLSNGFRKIERGSQRLRRGWDDTHTWDLGVNLCLQLSEQLEHLAQTAHGWPDSAEHDTYESWIGQLRTQSAALRRAGGSYEYEQAETLWYSLIRSKSSDPKSIKDAEEKLLQIEQEDLEAAKRAMHWVADHINQLWD